MSSNMATYPEGIDVDPREEPSSAASQQNDTSDSRLRESPHILEPGESDDENLQVSQGKKLHPKLKLAVQIMIKLLLFGIVLTCVTFSKLTLIRLTDDLRNVVPNTNVTSEEVRLEFLS